MGDLLSFDGRINRGTFWKFTALLFVVYLFSAFLWAASVDSFTGQPGGGLMILAILIWLALIPVSFSISARRWHDLGKSGWWILVGLVPFIGGLYALAMTGFVAGDPGPNAYGNPEGYRGDVYSPNARPTTAVGAALERRNH